MGKRYRIGQPRQPNALAQVIGDALRAPLRLLGVGSNPISALMAALAMARIRTRVRTRRRVRTRKAARPTSGR